jgi:hypothetical protein
VSFSTSVWSTFPVLGRDDGARTTIRLRGLAKSRACGAESGIHVISGKTIQATSGADLDPCRNRPAPHRLSRVRNPSSNPLVVPLELSSISAYAFESFKKMILPSHQVRTGLRCHLRPKHESSAKERHHGLETKEVPRLRYDFCDSVGIICAG